MKVQDFFKKFASWHLWLNLLGMFFLLVLLLVGLRWWLGVYTHHGEGIEVPDVSGMDYLAAEELLESRGLHIEVNDSSYQQEKPAGCIILQQPAGGMKVKEGRVVYVVINSLTIPRRRIPDLVDNTSYREARARLEALEMIVTEPRLIDGEKDWVYGIQCNGRNVQHNDMLAVGSRITLIIGKGEYGEDDMEDDFGIYIPPAGSDDAPQEDDVEPGTDDDVDTFLPVDELPDE